LFEECGGQIDVVDLAGLLVVKMGVWAKVRAVAGGTALVVHLADEPALHEGFEAVINRGEGDGGHLCFDAGENFLGGWVITLLEERTVNQFALRRGAKPAVGELLREAFGGDVRLFDHGEQGVRIRIVLNVH